ncbi:MAG: hypothetical protein B7X04_00445 [Parcubacteria group bacterium 21-54-25]|nr:MAG: hypothetical protein B7X04_00445 [Parcubacteria group bacterium 21-54-25]HQU07475.1 CARDB domain-containing protein [Candidatus Paceibacterota bacterium]
MKHSLAQHLFSYTARAAVLSLAALFVGYALISPAVSHAAVPGSLGAPTWTATNPAVHGGGHTVANGNYLYSGATNFISGPFGGTWYIEKRNKTGVLDWSINESLPSALPCWGGGTSNNECNILTDIAVGNNFVYVVGMRYVYPRTDGAGYEMLRVEKRSKSTGQLLAAVDYGPPYGSHFYNAAAYSVAVGTNNLYVGGGQNAIGSFGPASVVVLKINKVNFLYTAHVLPTSGGTTGAIPVYISLDGNNIYLASENGSFTTTLVQGWKKDFSSQILTQSISAPPGSSYSEPTAILAFGNLLYIGWLYAPPGGSGTGPFWVLSILDKNTGTTIATRNSGGAYGSISGISTNGSNIYVSYNFFVTTGLFTSSSNGYRIEAYPVNGTAPSWSQNYLTPSISIGPPAVDATNAFVPGSEEPLGSPIQFYLQDLPIIPSASPPTPSINFAPSPPPSGKINWSCNGNGSNITSVTIVDPSGATAYSSSPNLPFVSGSYTPTTSGTYTLTCTSPGGPATAPVTVPALSLPDLTAGGITPTNATVGTPITLQATITNQGAASTGAPFTDLFQSATQITPSLVGVTGIGTAPSPTLAAGQSQPATLSHTFSSAGAIYVRACADSTDLIPESNENNNCGAWTPVTVSAAVPVVAGVCATTHYQCTTPSSSTNHGSGVSAWTWSCPGTGGGSTASCFQPKPTAGICGVTHYSCIAGTSINDTASGSGWTWSCQGVGGGSTSSCSEAPTITSGTLTAIPIMVPRGIAINATFNWSLSGAGVTSIGSNVCQIWQQEGSTNTVVDPAGFSGGSGGFTLPTLTGSITTPITLNHQALYNIECSVSGGSSTSVSGANTLINLIPQYSGF